jgi:hypothetical protein
MLACCPEIRRRGSSGLSVTEVEKPAEARSTPDTAFRPVVIRRTDVPDQLATDALVKPLGHVVLDELLDMVFTKRSAYGSQLRLCAGKTTKPLPEVTALTQVTA